MGKKKYFDPVIFERVYRKAKQFKKEAEKNQQFAEKWLIIAKEDIDIAELLHENGHFAGAVYHLQQAFEKLTKGYYILSGRLSPDQAKSHHFVLKRLKKQIKEEFVNDFLDLSKSIDDNKFDLESANTSLSIIDKTEDELRKIDHEQIWKIFILIDNIARNINSEEIINKTEKKLNEKKTLKSLRHVIQTITHFRIRIGQIKKEFDRDLIVSYIQGGVIGIKLHFLSLLTFLHFNSPRYPYDNHTEVTFFDYNEDLGIVNKIPDFIVRFNEIYDLIRQKGSWI